MLVARIATWAAVGLAVIGLMLAVNDGDVFLAAAALSVFFVAALFWTLAEIGDRIRHQELNLVIPQETGAGETTVHEDAQPGNSTLRDLERKIAAARAR